MRDPEVSQPLRKKVRKPFGIKSGVYTSWYATEKARDQALRDLDRHTCNILKQFGVPRNWEKVNR